MSILKRTANEETTDEVFQIDFLLYRSEAMQKPLLFFGRKTHATDVPPCGEKTC